MAKRNWSTYQTNIFSFVKDGNGNGLVEAVAGSGKTTTIVEALKFCYGPSIFLAFNKLIATELKERGVNAKTFHSLTYSPVLRAKKGRQFEDDKMRKIFKGHWNDEDQQMYMAFCSRLVGLGKQVGIDCLIPDSPEVWFNIIEHHELELDHEKAQYPRAVEIASELLTLSNTHPTWINYDDMLYLCVRDGIKLPKFSYVFVDEAQDTNSIQRAILKKLFREETRMVAVGDPAQAIYGFRGADSDSMTRIKNDFNCQPLPLTVSYRCPVNIVQHARKWVKHIEHAPDAPAGEVKALDQQWKPEDFAKNDMVVCRTTRPLIALGYQLLKARKPFYIVGKEIGDGLKKLVTKQKAKTIEVLCERLTEWMEREKEKAIAKDNAGKAESIQDKFDALMYLVDSLPEKDRSVNELVRVIGALFDEKDDATKLCTIHKSKGLEADRVWWLNSSMCPAPWARGWQADQEKNICYIATTRAKKSLMLIEEKDGPS